VFRTLPGTLRLAGFCFDSAEAAFDLTPFSLSSLALERPHDCPKNRRGRRTTRVFPGSARGPFACCVRLAKSAQWSPACPVSWSGHVTLASRPEPILVDAETSAGETGTALRAATAVPPGMTELVLTERPRAALYQPQRPGQLGRGGNVSHARIRVHASEKVPRCADWSTRGFPITPPHVGFKPETRHGRRHPESRWVSKAIDSSVQGAGETYDVSLGARPPVGSAHENVQPSPGIGTEPAPVVRRVRVALEDLSDSLQQSGRRSDGIKLHGPRHVDGAHAWVTVLASALEVDQGLEYSAGAPAGKTSFRQARNPQTTNHRSDMSDAHQHFGGASCLDRHTRWISAKSGSFTMI